MTQEEVLAALDKSIEYLNVDELFELCKKISEKHLTPEHELYRYFHDDNNKKKEGGKT